MKRTVAGVMCAAALTASFAVASPASAAGTTVTSPSCGVLKVTNTTSSAWITLVDSGDYVEVPAGTTRTLTGLPGGSYVWLGAPATADYPSTSGSTLVKPCTGSPSRPVDGDQNRDGKADVLGIQAGTGDLYYYRMTATTLATGIKAGTGWNSMVFMQQVNEIEGEGTGNYLLAVRNDGTLWRYDNKGAGRFSNGTRIASGLDGYTNFTITGTNSPLSFGSHALIASKGDVLYMFDIMVDGLGDPIEIATGWGTTVKTIATRDFNKDQLGDLVTIREDGTMWAHTVSLSTDETFTTPRRVGHGWGAMQTVSSPGSLNGDSLSDLIARRSDGNLYKYINQGGVWAPAQQIGWNWQGIRLLA
ncbi:hypothetical protein ACTQ49_07200 [Luteococcus sp. Sow4_B9]|uniref:hypothetical protein n=1 Tax=Luteococcus sp. Sow4_B9 TaxID=3438792 RepID=UPI003F9A7AE6